MNDFGDLPQGLLASGGYWHPDLSERRSDYAALEFLRSFSLPKALVGARLFLTASQRFHLYLDGNLLARGPSRSDPHRHGVVRIDLPPLEAGEHRLSAEVFHFGPFSGIGAMDVPGFFLVYGETGPAGKAEAGKSETGAEEAPDADREKAVDFNALVETRTWLVRRDLSRQGVPPIIVIGAAERIDAGRMDFEESDWKPAKRVGYSLMDDWGNRHLHVNPIPDPLPQMREEEVFFARAFSFGFAADPFASGTAGSPGAFGTPGASDLFSVPLVLAPGREYRLVLDRGILTNAYPALRVSGGAGSRIRITWSEAPYDDEKRKKSDRDQIDGKNFQGLLDEFLPDGGKGRLFAPLWFRSFRYAEMRIETAETPLTLESFRLRSVAYPFTAKGSFTAREGASEGLSAAFSRIWEVSRRTLLLCSHETIWDCPHYEQAQFPGDSRIQALYHYLVCDDDRLAKKAIGDFHASRLAQGLTQCRYPSRKLQVLATFSLYWIGMLHDYRLYRGLDRGGRDFLRPFLHFAREVLEWFERRLRADGLLGFIEHAPYTDWVADFACGNAPQEEDGGSSILSLLFAEACLWQADLEGDCGYAPLASHWRGLAQRIKTAVLREAWDEERGLLRDTVRRGGAGAPSPMSTAGNETASKREAHPKEAKRVFSVHAQVQGALAGLWSPEEAARILGRALDDETVIQPGTLYYKFYVCKALRQSGDKARLFAYILKWDEMLKGTGLTTWPEMDVNPRSDCHAWSVSPPLEFLQSLLGVEPDPEAPGFERFLFRPYLGPLAEAEGTVMTPRGAVSVRLKRVRGKGSVSQGGTGGAGRPGAEIEGGVGNGIEDNVEDGIEVEIVSPVPFSFPQLPSAVMQAAGRHGFTLPSSEGPGRRRNMPGSDRGE